MENRLIENRQLVGILTMFMIVQFAGITLAALSFNGATYQEIASSQIVSGPSNALLLLGYIIFLAVVMILIFRFYHGAKLFRVIEGVVIFIASFYVFLILLDYLIQSANMAAIGAAILAILLVAAKNKWVKLKNVAAIIASIGVGAVLGFGFSFLAAIIFMGLLAIYDFVAVFITKHMITLANVVTDNNLAFMVDMNEVEAVPKSNFSKKELSEYNKYVKSSGQRGKRILSVMKKTGSMGMVPISANVALGTGDLAIPLMVAVSAYKLTLSFVPSFFIALGAVLGLILTMFILRKYKRALPAIPPLFLGVLIGFALYYFVYYVV
ncbi:presenilin family intramembrane aspartyl protease [Candidatus Marsarchaeota archaeon]|nr:presenilin family intramembrane aspartyl protease [Candidatus Marsarchaeota archaeon]